MTCEGERHDGDPPWGIFGGHDGLNASLIKNPGQDGEENWPSKITGRRLTAGDAVQITTPNGGGYGEPLERHPDLVLADVLDGFTSIEAAEREYGVVIDPDGMTVDGGGTEEDQTGTRSAQRLTVRSS